MVQGADAALHCDDCHSASAKSDTTAPTRLDWKALGYPGDPVQWGGRRLK
jgi:hypothetical protein